MSGFIGLLSLDGSPIDCRLLRDLTGELASRGPDAQETWCDESVGFGHALLQIDPRKEFEKQPAQIDGRLWIVADARVDARAELIDKLKNKRRTANELSMSTPDAELILHAYDAWGEDCVEHLLGDFSFAIWDAREKRLFCARDQMGVKQFYYAHVGSTVVVSNSINCIHRHPAVSNRLNDLAIADFLLFDSIQDLSTTSFADIQQLGPAHVLKCERGSLSVRKYWELPIAAPAHFSSDEECLQRFQQLLDTVVEDRLRGCDAGIMMSGGLDSTTVAVSAQRVLARGGNHTGVRAYTEVFDSLLPHKERHYATLAARALKIPIEYLVSDHWKIFERAEEPGYRLPCPMHLAWPDSSTRQLTHIAVRSRIALTGMGADPALSSRISVHFRQLLRKGRVDRAAMDLARYLFKSGRLSRLYLRTRLNILIPRRSAVPPFPEWLNSDLESKLSLRDRWAAQSSISFSNLSARPEAYGFTANPSWASLFEAFDTAVTQVPVEVRHPFFDLRMLNFLLSLPRLPWSCDKELLRQAVRGYLPDEVRLRRKSPMPAEPLNALLRKPESAWVDRFEPVAELGAYVQRKKIPQLYRERDTWTAWVHLRPLSLNFWLRLRDC